MTRNIKPYSIWLDGMPDGSIKARRLGAYIGTSFIDACKRACYDRYGIDQTDSCFHISKSGLPYFSGCKFYEGRV